MALKGSEGGAEEVPICSTAWGWATGGIHKRRWRALLLIDQFRVASDTMWCRGSGGDLATWQGDMGGVGDASESEVRLCGAAVSFELDGRRRARSGRALSHTLAARLG